MPADRPNILVVLLDQWRFDAAGFAGNPIAKTPNFDRFAAQGVQLQQTYCASPVCSPAKASLLTGLYPHAHDQLGNYGLKRKGAPHFHLRRDVTTLGDVCHAAGYRCGVIGPWHLGDDETPQRGFYATWQTTSYQTPETDAYVQHVLKTGSPEILEHERPPITRLETDRGTVEVPVAPATIPLPFQRTVWAVDSAIEFVESHAAPESDPFCLLLSIKDPHPPIAPPPACLERYPLDQIPLPPHYDDDFEDRFLSAPRNHIGPTLGPEGIRLYIQHYLALVSHVDDQFGRLLESLNRAGLDDSTIVMLTSDHGEMLGEHGLFNKVVLHEPSIRVPCVLRGPGITPGTPAGAPAPAKPAHSETPAPGHPAPGTLGRRIETPIASVDLFPTLCELAGLEPPSPIHGRSIARALSTGTEPEPRDILIEIGAHSALSGKVPGKLGHGIMIRRGPWKLVWYHDGPVELYNLTDDPHEVHNLATNPAHSALVHTLQTAATEGLNAPPDSAYGWLRTALAPKQGRELFSSDR